MAPYKVKVVVVNQLRVEHEATAAEEFVCCLGCKHK